jgi:uncharacterized protein YkwD
MFMKKILVIELLIIAMAIALFALFAGNTEEPIVAEPFVCEFELMDVIDSINQVRLAPVKEDSHLTDFAEYRKTGAYEDWNHDGFLNRPDKYTVPSKMGEVLYRGPECHDSKEIVVMWLESPTHKEVILDPAYNKVGVAEYRGTIVAVFSQ